MNGASQGTIIRVHAAGNKIILTPLNKKVLIKFAVKTESPKGPEARKL